MQTDFEDIIGRVFQGDSAAAAQLVHEYEPEVRRIVRFRLRDPRLRRVIDSTDICQSVFAKFFFQAALGHFELNSPEQLVRLLSKMATNRVIDRYRTEQSQRRLTEARSQDVEFGDGGERMASSEYPENVAQYNEMLQSVRDRLTDEEKEISQLRVQGKSWFEVAEQLGSSPQALRKRLERACNRVFSELGIVIP